MYRLLDPSVHSVALSVDDLGLIPIHDRTAANYFSTYVYASHFIFDALVCWAI